MLFLRLLSNHSKTAVSYRSQPRFLTGLNRGSLPVSTAVSYRCLTAVSTAGIRAVVHHRAKNDKVRMKKIFFTNFTKTRFRPFGEDFKKSSDLEIFFEN